MFDFEREIVDNIVSQSLPMTEFVKIYKEKVVKIDPKEHFPFQYGPIESFDAQREIGNHILNTCCDVEQPYHRSSVSKSNARSILSFEDNLQNIYIPTAIVAGLENVGGVSHEEAKRFYWMGPWKSHNPDY